MKSIRIMCLPVLLLMACGSEEESDLSVAGGPVTLSDEVIDSKSPDNRPPVTLQQGASYRITPQLLSSEWTDAGEKADFEGWLKRDFRVTLFQLFAKVRELPFYSLVGCIGEVQREHCFKIGKGLTTHIARRSGRLTIFVNDVDGFFGNNTGKARVSIQRLSGAGATPRDKISTGEDCTCTRAGRFGRVTCTGGPNHEEEPKCGGPFRIPVE